LEGYKVLQPADTGLMRSFVSEKLLGKFEEHGEAAFPTW
jgi:hypothetical protein